MNTHDIFSFGDAERADHDERTAAAIGWGMAQKPLLDWWRDWGFCLPPDAQREWQRIINAAMCGEAVAQG